MAQLSEAIARYHKILESQPFQDQAWLTALKERMQAEHLYVSGRPVTPVLRPHFITTRQYSNLVKATESLVSAVNRIKQLALSSPVLLSRMELLPAEKMLAGIDPGYPFLSVASLLDTSIHNGHMQVMDYVADAPVGVVFGEALGHVFYDAGPMKEFRKKYPVTRTGSTKQLLHALLKAYKEFGGKKSPNIAIVEFKQPFQTIDSAEYNLLADILRKQGHPTEVVPVDQLEYKNGVLRRGDFAIDLVYRRVKVHEFLVRYDLTHPLVRAYRDRAVCMVNSFRSELSRKKAIFDLLTDETLTGSFPAAERKAIRDFIPWTRVVAARQTMYHDTSIDLLDFIVRNQAKLVLKPNDDSGEHHSVRGWETDAAGWERALKQAQRSPYVVQERVEPTTASFPVLSFGGKIEYRELQVDVLPHAFLGKVQGCSTWLNPADSSKFSTVTGVAPTFILDAKS